MIIETYQELLDCERVLWASRMSLEDALSAATLDLLLAATQRSYEQALAKDILPPCPTSELAQDKQLPSEQNDYQSKEDEMNEFQQLEQRVTKLENWFKVEPAKCCTYETATVPLYGTTITNTSPIVDDIQLTEQEALEWLEAGIDDEVEPIAVKAVRVLWETLQELQAYRNKLSAYVTTPSVVSHTLDTDASKEL
jgi:hypothetical protein